MASRSLAARLEALERLERASAAGAPVRCFMAMHYSDWERWSNDTSDPEVVRRFGLDRLQPDQRVEWCIHVYADGAERWFPNCNADARGEPAHIWGPSTYTAEQWQGLAAIVILVDQGCNRVGLQRWAITEAGEAVEAPAI